MSQFNRPQDERLGHRRRTALRARRRSAVVLLFMALSTAVPRLPPRVDAQTMPIGEPRRFGTSPLDFGPVEQSMDARRLIALNAERQKRLTGDSAAILKLAQELNAEIHEDDSAAWTPQQMRKLAEIEKLARNVRERMVYAPMPMLAPVRPLSNQR